MLMLGSTKLKRKNSNIAKKDICYANLNHCRIPREDEDLVVLIVQYRRIFDFE